MAASADEWVVRRPEPALQPMVDRYIGYRLMGHPPSLHRGLPSRHMTFIVGIGAPIDVIAQTDPSQRPQAYRCVLGGLQASSALIAHTGDQEGVAIQMRPPASRALFGMPARALWDLSVELGDVVGAVGDELWERLQPAMSWDERFAVCDEVLRRLARPATADPVLERSWDDLVRSGGQVAVGELAARTGWSRQHLGRRFRDEFGMSPKLASRVVRFERAGRMLRSAAPPDSIAVVAAACGYFDQAHLNREVVLLAGCTPAELMDDVGEPAEADVPSVQDATAAGG